MYPFEKRKHVSRPTGWEIIDVELAHVFFTDDQSMIDDYKTSIENQGHRAIVHEIKS
jgi:hypothetical protein